MKCRIERHFIKVCTVNQDKIHLQRKKYIYQRSLNLYMYVLACLINIYATIHWCVIKSLYIPAEDVLARSCTGFACVDRLYYKKQYLLVCGLVDVI